MLNHLTDQQQLELQDRLELMKQKKEVLEAVRGTWLEKPAQQGLLDAIHDVNELLEGETKQHSITI